MGNGTENERDKEFPENVSYKEHVSKEFPFNLETKEEREQENAKTIQ